MEVIGDLIDRAIKACLKIQEKSGKNLKDFEALIKGNEDVEQIKKEVRVYLSLNCRHLQHNFICPGSILVDSLKTNN